MTHAQHLLLCLQYQTSAEWYIQIGFHTATMASLSANIYTVRYRYIAMVFLF